MDKDKFIHGSGSSLPPSGRYSGFSPPKHSYNLNPDLSGSSSLPPLGPGSSSEQGNAGHFSHDISRMSDNPPKNMGHRRAHSEILTLPDDISFDSDLGVVGGFDGPSFSDETEEDLLSMFLDMDKFNSTSASPEFQVGESSNTLDDNVPHGLSEKPRIRHQHSQSMDGSTTIKPEMLMSGSEDPSPSESKKATSAAKLAELALVDPKRAKRIWANRQSAARSKERKMRYISELERKVHTLQSESTTLSARFTLLQRDTNGLEAENSELKLRLQTVEQQVHLQDALNDAIKEDIQHLRALASQMQNGGGSMMNFPASHGGNQQYYSNNQAVHTLLTAQQLQQLQLHSQKQQFQQHQLHQFQQQQQLQNQQPQGSMPQQEQQMKSSMPSSVQNKHAPSGSEQV